MVEWITVAGEFVNLSNKLYEAAQTLVRTKRADREKVAALLVKIASATKEVANRVRVGTPASEFCGELHGYADELPTIMKRVYDSHVTGQLAGLLRKIYVDKQALVNVTQKEREDFANQVDEAVGRLKATANVMNAM